MTTYTRDEALAFIDAAKLNVEGRTGFTWYAERLEALRAYLESLADDHARLLAFLDARGLRDEYNAFTGREADDGGDP